MEDGSVNIIRKSVLSAICMLALIAAGFAGDGDISPKDLKGIPKHHKYAWAIAGGAAVGIGIGILLPGGSKTALKGLMIGSGSSSLWYLSRHPNAAGQWNSWAYVATNTTLGGGIGWLACDCGTGFGLGALGGGGGTALIQAMGTRNRTIADLTGAQSPTSTAANIPPPPPPKKP